MQAIGHELDHAAAFAVARALDRAAHAFEHGDQVVAVHLQAMQAAGDALLRQRLAPVCAERGTEIAQPLLMMHWISGSVYAPAELIAA